MRSLVVKLSFFIPFSPIIVLSTFTLLSIHAHGRYLVNSSHIRGSCPLFLHDSTCFDSSWCTSTTHKWGSCIFGILFVIFPCNCFSNCITSLKELGFAMIMALPTSTGKWFATKAIDSCEDMGATINFPSVLISWNNLPYSHPFSDCTHLFFSVFLILPCLWRSQYCFLNYFFKFSYPMLESTYMLNQDT